MNLMPRKYLPLLAVFLTAVVLFACSSCENHIKNKDRESGTEEISCTVETAPDDHDDPAVISDADPQAEASESDPDTEIASTDDGTEATYNDYGEWDIQ